MWAREPPGELIPHAFVAGECRGSTPRVVEGSVCGKLSWPVTEDTAKGCAEAP